LDLMLEPINFRSSSIVVPKLSDFQVCRPREIGFAFHRAGRYKKDVVSP